MDGRRDKWVNGEVASQQEFLRGKSVCQRYHPKISSSSFPGDPVATSNGNRDGEADPPLACQVITRVNSVKEE